MARTLREKVIDAFKEYYKNKPKIEEETIKYAGFCETAQEWINLLNCVLDGWITHSFYSELLEKKLRSFYGVKHAILVNSGSSANLLAVACLTNFQLLERRLKPGDEVIIPACCFPTTLAPIVQHQLIPVFLDSQIGTYNIQPRDIEKALSKHTKAIFITHTLGNPVKMDEVMEIAQKHNLWVIEDNCDSFGSKYNHRLTGTFGDLATLSFYPAHHMTTGEGGAILTNNDCLAKKVKSLRDWGRDCHCKPGQDNACGHRFEKQMGDLPYGYDHKYIFSNIGYNLKITDLQSSIGSAQIGKIKSFIRKRRANFSRLYQALKPFEGRVILPKWEEYATPSWFGFPLTLQNNIERTKLIHYLEEHHIQTRLLFAGNIIRQPAFKYIAHRTIDNLENSDRIMRDTLFLGVYPGLTTKKMNYIIKKLKEYFAKD